MSKEKCTLSDKELVEKCNEWVHSLAKSGGHSWTLQVPVNFNRDPDMLFIELGKRYEALKAENEKMRKVLKEISAIELIDELSYLRMQNLATEALKTP